MDTLNNQHISGAPVADIQEELTKLIAEAIEEAVIFESKTNQIHKKMETLISQESTKIDKTNDLVHALISEGIESIAKAGIDPTKRASKRPLSKPTIKSAPTPKARTKSPYFQP